jgi:hypothetical protein
MSFQLLGFHIGQLLHNAKESAKQIASLKFKVAELDLNAKLI